MHHRVPSTYSWGEGASSDVARTGGRGARGVGFAFRAGTTGVRVLVCSVFFLLAGIGANAGDRHWVVTGKWAGTGTCQTREFHVYSRKWRVRHRHQGSGLFQVGVYDAAGELLDMAANLREPVSGARTLPGRGTRYLAINGVDTTWEVEVEQYLSILEEWQLREAAKKPETPLKKYAVWFGEDTDADYTVTLPEPGSWKIVHTNAGAGVLQVLVRNEAGVVALAANSSDRGVKESWIHGSGTFTVHITAIKTHWKVEVLGP